MKIAVAAATLMTVASLTAQARTETPQPPGHKPRTDRWLPLVKGAVYHYTGTFEDKPYDSRVQVTTSITEHLPAGAASLLQLGHPDIWIAAKWPLLNDAWETADGIYTMVGFSGTPARIVALPPEIGAHVDVRGMVLDTDLKAPDTTFTVEEFEDLQLPAGRYPNCLKLAYHAGAVDGHVWFARGTGMVKWANQFGQAELVSYEASPTASKSAVDALVSRCKAGEREVCVDVATALLAGIFIDTGEHVRKDEPRAIALLAAACDKDRHPPACLVLGSHYMDPKHQRQSIAWLKKGCDLGDKNACAFLPKPAPRIIRPGEEPGPGLIGSLKAAPGTP